MLYLGSAKVSDLDTDAEIVAINRKGEVEPHQRAILSDIEGIVLLDGTWSQAKALWWRNAWMLKCQRVILGPKRPSRYGKLRKEPRGDGLSTIEAAGLLLAGLEKRPDIAETLNASFDRMLARYREVQARNAGARAEAEEAGLAAQGRKAAVQIGRDDCAAVFPARWQRVGFMPTQRPGASGDKSCNQHPQSPAASWPRSMAQGPLPP